MPYQTTVKRKTRQQKIQSSQRVKPEPLPITDAPAHSPVHHDAPLNSYAYVTTDLKKITWITITCLGLLAIATIFVSDLSLFESIRATLHLPTL